MIPVDRAKRGGAVASMIEGARTAVAEGRQIVIFPEGTRTAGGMRVTGGAGGDDVQLVFTDGVKLVYEPQRSED